MLRPVYPIRTARLLLRPFTRADVEDVWAYQRQPEVARYMSWEPRTLAQTEAAVAQMAREDRLAGEGDCLSLAVVRADLDRVVGQIELVWHSAVSRQGELGYVFNPGHHGQGLATEAAREMLRLGFEGLGLHRIVGRCHADNRASARLLERLGMRKEAHFVDNELVKGAWRSQLLYALLDSEWRLES